MTHYIPGQHVRWTPKDGYSCHGYFIRKCLFSKCLIQNESTGKRERIADSLLEWGDPEAYPIFGKLPKSVYYLRAECDFDTNSPVIKISTTCFTSVEKANKRVTPLWEKLSKMGFSSIKIEIKSMEIVE